MNKKPLVSILISSYCSEDSIGACLNACINQTITDTEIIVVEYGSDDSTLSIINNYAALDRRIKFYQREPFVFYSSAAREYAQGEFVLFVSPSAIIPADYLAMLFYEGSGVDDERTDDFGLAFYKTNSEQYASECLADAVISCITPAYNAAGYLAECLNSLISQSLFNIESLCIDDGSTDDTLTQIESFAFRDSRIHFAEGCHQGAAESRNLALRYAKGEFTFFLDADDTIPDNDIFDLLYRAAKAEHVLVCGGCFSDYDGNKLRTDYTGVQSGYTFSKNAKIRYSDYQFDYGFTRFIYNRELIIKNKLTFPNRSFYEDPVWFVRVMEQAEEFYGINRITYRYRKNHKPFRSSIFSEKDIADLMSGMSEILEIARRHGWNKLADLICTRFLNDYAHYVYPKLSVDRPDIIDKIEKFGRVSGLGGTLSMYRMSRRYMDMLVRRDAEKADRLQDEINKLRNDVDSKERIVEHNERQIADLRKQIEKQEFRHANLVKQIKQVKSDRDRVKKDYYSIKNRYDRLPHVRLKNGIKYARTRSSDRNKIVLQLRDRLGNQMFIYALYLKLISLGRKVSIDDTSMIAECSKGRIYDSGDLKRVFGIEYEQASIRQIEALRDTGTHKSDRLRRKLLGTNEIICKESKDFAYDESLLKTRRGYFEGYFQNIQYFNDIEPKIRSAFKFRPIPDSNTAANVIEQRIKSCQNTVSIHFRYGDYLTDINSKMYGGICTDQYYAECLTLIRQKTADGLSCFVFSDDPEGAGQWLQLHSGLFNADDSVTVVNVCGDSSDSWIDMYLMSLCRFNVIANSSFSFWASYLNSRQDKAVFGPLFWIRRGDELIHGVHTDDMILIDPDGNICGDKS